LLTPPDIISQVLLALPIWILFEAGLIASKMIFKDREQESDDETDEDGDTAVAPVSDHQPLSDEEMEAELDQAETDEAQLDKQ
jgi:sec-independent protein translocase protein TatC